MVAFPHLKTMLSFATLHFFSRISKTLRYRGKSEPVPPTVRRHMQILKTYWFCYFTCHLFEEDPPLKTENHFKQIL